MAQVTHTTIRHTVTVHIKSMLSGPDRRYTLTYSKESNKTF